MVQTLHASLYNRVQNAEKKTFFHMRRQFDIAHSSGCVHPRLYGQCSLTRSSFKTSWTRFLLILFWMGLLALLIYLLRPFAILSSDLSTISLIASRQVPATAMWPSSSTYLPSCNPHSSLRLFLRRSPLLLQPYHP
jgi:hypothetical protein